MYDGNTAGSWPNFTNEGQSTAALKRFLQYAP